MPNQNNNVKLMITLHHLRWKTVTTLANYTFLLVFYQHIILKPLSKDAGLMAHKDPIDIISVPLPLEQLQLFVTLSTISTFIFTLLYIHVSSCPPSKQKQQQQQQQQQQRKKSPLLQNLYELILHILTGTLLLFVIAILTGASPWISGHVQHTIWGTLYMSVVLFAPSFIPASLMKLEQDQEQNEKAQQQPQEQQQSSSSSLLPRSYSYYVEYINQSIFFVTIIVTVPIMILRILDWGIQNQRWPVPILLGSTVGYGGGMVIGLLLAWGDWIFCSGGRGRGRQHLMTVDGGESDDMKYS